MSSQKIHAVALELFTKKGYEGASLADIAELVGIKKSSIYNHYKSKDDLFIAIFMACYEAELLHTKRFFETTETKEILPLLHEYLEQRILAISTVAKTKFLFRFLTFPPFHLEEQLKTYKFEYFKQRQAILLKVLEAHPQLQRVNYKKLEDFTMLFLTLLNGRLTENFIGYETSLSSLKMMWEGFEKEL